MDRLSLAYSGFAEGKQSPGKLSQFILTELLVKDINLAASEVVLSQVPVLHARAHLRCAELESLDQRVTALCFFLAGFFDPDFTSR